MLDQELPPILSYIQAQERKETILGDFNNSQGTWFNRAVNEIRKLENKWGGRLFIAEELRWKLIEKIGEPEKPQIWGKLISHMVKTELLLETDLPWRPMQDKKSNGRRSPVYRFR